MITTYVVVAMIIFKQHAQLQYADKRAHMTIFVANVTVQHIPYMSFPRVFDRLHTIEAKDQDEAEQKLQKFYERKSIPNDDSWNVISVDWAEHIP